jgi:hypothetical protein
LSGFSVLSVAGGVLDHLEGNYSDWHMVIDHLFFSQLCLIFKPSAMLLLIDGRHLLVGRNGGY